MATHLARQCPQPGKLGQVKGDNCMPCYRSSVKNTTVSLAGLPHDFCHSMHAHLPPRMHAYVHTCKAARCLARRAVAEPPQSLQVPAHRSPGWIATLHAWHSQSRTMQTVLLAHCLLEIVSMLLHIQNSHAFPTCRELAEGLRRLLSRHCPWCEQLEGAHTHTHTHTHTSQLRYHHLHLCFAAGCYPAI